jgi:hypothetical protein
MALNRAPLAQRAVGLSARRLDMLIGPVESGQALSPVSDDVHVSALSTSAIGSQRSSHRMRLFN